MKTSIDNASVMERLQGPLNTPQLVSTPSTSGPKAEISGGALSWLQTPRTLTIKERNSERQFEFRVADGQEITPNDPVRSRSYALIWGARGIGGFISACDIADVRQSSADPSTFTITLKPRNPQAVCNSGGLQVIVIRTNSFAECTSYRTALNSWIE